MAVVITAAHVLRVTENRPPIDSDLAKIATLSLHARHALGNHKNATLSFSLD